MATHDIYIDVTTGKTVASVADSSIADLPQLVQGDSPTLRIHLLKSSSRAAPAIPVPTTGITIQVAIGTRTGGSSTYYTQQWTWTPNTDLADPYWEAVLPMNTEGIADLIGAADSANAWIQVRYLTGGLPTTVLLKEITILAAVIHDDEVQVPAGLTPLSAEAAIALYLQRTIIGPITLICADDETKKVSLYVGSDGEVHMDPVT